MNTSTDVAVANGAGVAGFNRDAILRALNLNPSDPKTQALLVVCDRYNLDPLLKHMVLIQGSPYVTRDGYLHVAHRSGVLDGIEVVETGETTTHYTAKVAVYRKDMSRPFVFVGRYPKSKQMAKEYGPEMAIKVAEVQSLRRAFNVTGVSAADEMWAEETPPTESGVERPGTAQVDAASPAAPPTTTRRPPPGRNVDPETGEVRTAPIPARSIEAAPAEADEFPPFTEADEKFDTLVARAIRDQARAAGIEAPRLAEIVHAVTGGRTNVITRVFKTEFDALEAAIIADGEPAAEAS